MNETKELKVGYSLFYEYWELFSEYLFFRKITRVSASKSSTKLFW